MKTLFVFGWLLPCVAVYAQRGTPGSPAAGAGATATPGIVQPGTAGPTSPNFSSQFNNNQGTTVGPNTGPNTTPLGPTTTPGNLSQPGIPGTLTPNTTFGQPAGASLPNLATNNLTPNLTPGITPNVNSVTPGVSPNTATPGPSFGPPNTFTNNIGAPTP